MFSSHILHDAELLCDRVAMIMKGKLVACGHGFGFDRAWYDSRSGDGDGSAALPKV